MKAPKNVDAFLAALPDEWRLSFVAMREILLTTDLEESIKWQLPVYGFGKKNVVGLFNTKKFAAVWFFQGALLHDPDDRLVNAEAGKTVAQRQLRFASPADVDLELLRSFVHAAIQNQLDGLEIKPQRNAEVVIPSLLRQKLDEDAALRAAFANFSPYKQREFCESINNAKREDTKLRRLEKMIPLILSGVGLGDKYRK